MLPCVPDDLDLSLNASVPETSRHKHAVDLLQSHIEVYFPVFDVSAFDPGDLDSGTQIGSCMSQRLYHRDIGIAQCRIFAADGDSGRFDGLLRRLDQLFPQVEIRRTVNAESCLHQARKPLFLKYEGQLVDRIEIGVGYHCIAGDVGEEGDLFLCVIIEHQV